MELIGDLVADESALALAATDFGHIVGRRPRAVLRPASTSDIATIVRTATAEHLGLAARGSGHSCLGQAQAQDGIVVDMSTLSSVHRIDGDTVSVDAGARWSAVLARTLPHGLTPPVLTDYIGTTVGGTLSVGGIGGTSHRHGLQVDNVLELDIVTGDGTSHTCSPTRNSQLFDLARAGLGQFGIITRAVLRLVAAPARVRRYTLFHDSIATATATQLALIRSGRFDFVQGQVRTDEHGWRYLIEVARYYTPPTAVDDPSLLDGLSHQLGTEVIEDLTYAEFQNRLAAGETYLRSTGEWLTPHPCWNGFFPASATNEFLEHLTDRLTTADIGVPGLILFYPIFTTMLSAPLLRVPDEQVVFLIGILPFPPDRPNLAQTQVELNSALYRHARSLDAITYPIGAIPFTHEDWQHHYGPRWNDFASAKQHYDPRHIFAPGQGIF